MAIVKMKRLRLIALSADREKLLGRLQALGCLEVADAPPGLQEDPAWAGLTRPSGEALAMARGRRDAGVQALELLKRYGGVKVGGLTPRPEVTGERFFDERAYMETETVVDNICAAQWNLSAMEAEAAKLQGQRAALAPWLGLEAPLDAPSDQWVTALLGTVPLATDLEAVGEELGELCTLTAVGADRSFQYIFLLCHKSVEEKAQEVLQRCSFSRTVFRGLSGTAAENDARLERELEDNARKRERTVQLIADFAGHGEDVKLYVDRVNQEVRREEAKLRLAQTGETFLLTGWFPAEEEETLAKLLEDYPCAWEAEEPGEEEYPEVPVKLKNNWFTRPLSMVTEMYSLPAYGTVDPNPLMAPFFILFYGIMLADMGYGLLMVLVSLVVQKKFRPKGPTMRHMIPLLGLCGVSTFIMGALTGSFFGDFIPQIAKLIDPDTTLTALPALFTPLEDTLMILVGSMALGLVQIVTGMLVSFIEKLKRGQVVDAVCEEVTWWVVFLGIGLMAAGVTNVVLILGVVMVVAGPLLTGKGFGRITGVFGSLYNHITGYFGDVLSYSRLMALMLAGNVIAQVFNTLGAIAGNVVVFLLISMVGNALNFGLNLLGCYVHDLRLQCLEYFGKFYQDGGRAFRPLELDTKYCDIIS